MQTVRYLNAMVIFLNIVVTILVSIWISGCGLGARNTPPRLAPIAPTSLPDPEAGTAHQTPGDGSLFREGRAVNLVSDFRARHIGDVVTIILQENMKGAKDVTTSTAEQTDFNFGLSGIFGFELKDRVGNRYPNETVDPLNAFGGQVKDAFNGSGKTSRDASLTGTISARVIEVLPGGNLLISGTRALKINNETQYLTISGVVRPADISPDNTVSSTKIAEARIEYTGTGVLADKQRPGWFSRVLSVMLPF